MPFRSSMQDLCHNEPGKYDVACHVSPSSSDFGATAQCTEGHGFSSHRKPRATSGAICVRSYSKGDSAAPFQKQGDVWSHLQTLGLN